MHPGRAARTAGVAGVHALVQRGHEVRVQSGPGPAVADEEHAAPVPFMVGGASGVRCGRVAVLGGGTAGLCAAWADPAWG